MDILFIGGQFYGLYGLCGNGAQDILPVMMDALFTDQDQAVLIKSFAVFTPLFFDFPDENDTNVGNEIYTNAYCTSL